jgi:hypothetical protein
VDSAKPPEVTAPSPLAAIMRSQMLLDRGCRFLTRDEAFNRIRSDYLELPGLQLTVAQAARLWSLGFDFAASLLEDLVARNFLFRRGDQYCLRSNTALPPPKELQRQPETHD